jgi:aspartyl-tRNA(Asn)/glutamyl-tRNA(Gln) amidotransferase subunit B
MEEDTGKLTHAGNGASLVDYNRAGVPLLEIVSEPDLNSAAEAEAYASKLRAILRYLGVNNGDMSKGILRFEANVSVMHQDDTDFRTRTEIKNLNSIRNMGRAIDYEVQRQIRLYEKGENVVQATLGWDENSQKVVIQRTKERADEYRYFPEPDLPIIEVSREWVAAVQAQIPELPEAKQQRFMRDLGLSDYDARQLVAERSIAEFYESALAAGADAKITANWITGSLFALMNTREVSREDIDHLRFSPSAFGTLVKLVSDGTLNKGTATTVLEAMWDTGADPAQIVAEKGLAQVSDSSLIEDTVRQVLAQNAAMVQRYLGGEDKLLGALMGECMKALKGQGNPQIVRETLQKILAEKG